MLCDECHLNEASEDGTIYEDLCHSCAAEAYYEDEADRRLTEHRYGID